MPAWITAARRGDGGALDALYRRFAPVVHGVLLGYVQTADADDLTQDVFETALKRLHELREPAAFPGWIIAIARRAAFDHLRRRAPAGVLDDSMPSGDTSQDERLDAQRTLHAIRTLPQAYRETLLLRLVEGLNGPEIAARTGLTPGSVRVNLHRGMERLRQLLTPDAEGER